MKINEILLEKIENISVTKNFFNFGSMRDLDVLETVLGRKVNKKDVKRAYLSGYIAMKVKNEVYPALKKGDGITKGILVFNLSLLDLKKIDFYEEGLYDTTIKYVRLIADPSMVYKAQVYSKNSSKLKITNIPWNFDHYRDKLKDEYIKEVKIFMKDFTKVI